MNPIDIEPPYTHESDDICTLILSMFSSSLKEDHQRVCMIIGTMSQELSDHNVPLTPVAYFGAASSSLDRICSDMDLNVHTVEAILTILSFVLPKLSFSIVRKKSEYLSELFIRSIMLAKPSDGAVVSGLECIGRVLIAANKVKWSDVSQLYGFLLGFITESRSMVRRESHVCNRNALQSFQSTPILAPASEGFTKILERSLLLAGGAKITDSEGSKGAQDVLYILDALKECLPFLSAKSTANILKYFKTLLELHQPLVSRRIKDILHVLCLDQSSEIAPELLVDLLCVFSGSISGNETSPDAMTSTARLLDIGMRRIFALNRQTSVVKLPVVFIGLKDIFAFEHAEASFASLEALKNLIHGCIDEHMIGQGVEQITSSTNLNERKSGPTIIEKVCAIVESLLDYRFCEVWDMSFQVVSVLFDKLGEYSFYLLRETLKNLDDIQKLPEPNFPYRKQLHECIGSALGAMGPEHFLTIVPFKLDAEDISNMNAWLFPIMKKYTVGARIRFFKEKILRMIVLIKQKSKTHEVEGRIFSSRSNDALVYSLWSLFPSFCNYPIDTAESFGELGKTLCNILRDESDVVGIICSGLQILIQQNKVILDGINDISDVELSISRKRAMSHYTIQVATDNLSVLKSSAHELLIVLSGIFLKSTKNAGGCLQATIRDVVSLLDKKVVTRFFRATMQKLLIVTTSGIQKSYSKKNSMEIEMSSNEGSPSHDRAQLFDLAVSLLPGLNIEEIKILFSAIEPALADADGMIQKKAYKVLSLILRNSDGFLLTNLEKLLEVMVGVLPSCHFSAKRHRLDCLYFLMIPVSKDELQHKRHEVVCAFLTEILFALKEPNKKTRNRAYELLVQIGHAYGDDENGGNKENLHLFFCMVANGMKGQTPHMISAAVKGIARLTYEFTDLVSMAYNVLPFSYLLQKKNKEVIKANLGLLKVLVAKSHGDTLHGHLQGMIEGLMKWQDNAKNHFKAKVKLLVEMLVRKCGLEAVKAVMPEEHIKLLTNIRKAAVRKERKHTARSKDSRTVVSKLATSRQSGWNHTKIFSDFSDEESEGSDLETIYAKNTISSRRSKIASKLKLKATLYKSKGACTVAKSLSEDMLDRMDPLDLLDRQKTRSVLRCAVGQKQMSESDDEPEVDCEGRLVIREGKMKEREGRSEPNSVVGSLASLGSSRKNQKRQKTSYMGRGYTGSDYGSKKGDGDVKRKGKLEPYAYWPLDRKMISRRSEHRATARRGMASVVKMAKTLRGKSSREALSVKGLKFKRKSSRKSH